MCRIVATVLLPLFLTAPPPDIVAGRPLSAWLADLDANDVFVRDEAVAVIADLPEGRADAALPRLRALAKDGAAESRVRAALAVWAVTGETEGAAAVSALAATASPALRQRVAAELARREKADVDAARLAVILFADPLTRSRGEETLRQMGTAGAGACVAVLKDADPRVRRGAAAFLDDHPFALVPDRADDLRLLLKSEDPVVRRTAALLLLELRAIDKAVVAELKSAFETGTPNERLRIVSAARRPTVAKAIAPILDRARDDDHPRVRLWAARYLYAVDNDTPALLAVLEYSFVRGGESEREAVDVAAHFGVTIKPLLPNFLSFLKSAHGPGFSTSVYEGLRGMGPDAVPPLVELLKRSTAGGERFSRPEWRAASALARMNAPAVKAVLPLLDDKDPGVRLRAVWVMGPNGRLAAAAVPRLVELTRDADDETAAGAAVDALARVGPVAAVKARPRLTELAKEPTPAALRAKALAALVRVGDAKGNEAVAAAALKAAEPVVREQAAELIFESRPDSSALRDYAVGLLASPDTRASGLTLLARTGRAAAPALAAVVGCLGDNRDAVKQEALKALAAIGPAARGAAPKVAALLKSGGGWVASEAAQTLPKLDAPAVAVPALRAVLDSPVRGWDADSAADALGECGPPAKAAFPAILRLVRARGRTHRRVTAAVALARIDAARARRECPADFFALLRETRRDASLEAMAVHALLLLDAADKDAFASVERMLAAPDAEDRQLACEALGRLGPLVRPFVPRFRALMADESLRVRLGATAAYATAGDPEEVVAVLEKMLRGRRGSDRYSAVSGLLGLGAAARPALPALAKAAEAETSGELSEFMDIAIRKIAGPTSPE